MGEDCYGDLSETFQAMVGTEQPFYGVDANRFKLGDHVFEAVEDPSDGYRSYLGSIDYVDPADRPIFFPDPLDIVTVKAREGNPDEDGFVLVAADGHIWLTVGTDDADDYYPIFTFEYVPRA